MSSQNSKPVNTAEQPKLSEKELEKQEEEIKFKFAAMRYKLLRSHPYLATAILALNPIRKNIGTFACDKHWNLYYDPQKLLEWSLAECHAVLLHEVNHILRKHFIRAEHYPKEHALIINCAEDICINFDIKEEGLQLPSGLLLPEKFNLPNNLSWEEYYELLLKDHTQFIEFCGPDCKDDPECPNNKNKNNSSNGTNNTNTNKATGGNKSTSQKGNEKHVRIHVDCGSCAHGHEQDYEEPGEGGIDKDEQILIIKQVAQATKDYADKHPGKVPAGMRRWAESLLNSKIPWEKEFRAAFKRMIAHKQGMVDFCFTRPARRQSLFPTTILPSLRRPTPKIAVIIDTSGSMDAYALSSALAEVKGILNASGTMRETTVITLDTEVGFARKIVNPKQIQLVGGGGTDMRAGWEYIKEKKIKSDVIICMTDGYSPFHDTNPIPGTKSIILLVGKDTVNKPVVPWAKTIVVDKKAVVETNSYD